MIEAKKQELEKSFKVHYSKYKERVNSSRNSNKSEKLILFYAIECGAKALLLNKIKKNTTKGFMEHNTYKEKMKGTGGHNIKYILREINYGNVKLPDIICKNGEKASSQEYNQVWRYGIECDGAIEEDIEKELIKIATWLEKKI